MKWLIVMLFAVAALAAQAREATPMADDEALEQRLVAIADELRCLVCQNESLSGSRAELAQDLRREIRSLMRAGKTDAQILDYLVSRYGDFVRYRPPLKPVTWLLWFGPFIFLGAALGALTLVLRRRERLDRGPHADGERAEGDVSLAGDR
jgi:cytochrome c-type biogenesis protein CcmH